ncbi:MAG: hypothetical protein PHY14_00400 [Candidatus Gracilibacteria bacterium]|nr:hypothetical protein [Candidatus Gracilibacteria bacterium]
MSKRKSLIVVDMQEEFLGRETEYPDFYLSRRQKLIEGVQEYVVAAIEKKNLVINITFGDSPIVPELRDVLLSSEVRQFSKHSVGLLRKSVFSNILEGEYIRRTLVQSDKAEFSAIFPRKGIMGYPIKELLSRGGSCDIVGVSTVECVLSVNLDLQYLANRVKSNAHFRVLGSLCMTSNPQICGEEVSEKSIDDDYRYWGLPGPIWHI